MEHYVLHCYRDDPAFVPELDFVMELNGELIGQVIYVRSEIKCDDGRKVPIMTFGPISIAPAYKRQSYGKQLLDYSMEKAKEMGAGALAITGNIDFYGKSGFVPAKTKGVRYADDPDVRDPIKFLRAREIVHYQRFGEGLRILTDRLDSKNFYAFNSSFDK